MPRAPSTSRPPPRPAGATAAWQAGVATLEFALVAPVLMLLIIAALQFGLWYHAQHVVLGAAQEAARLAAAEDGTPASGHARALDLIRVGLGADAGSASVTVTKGAQVTTATVAASIRPLLPVASRFTLRAEAQSVTERFRADVRGFGDSEVRLVANRSLEDGNGVR